MTDTLANLDATAQAELVARGELSALELVDAAIARVEALEPELHALAATDFEAARDRAKAGLDGPLAGVPFLIKDLAAYPGLRHSMGSRLFAANVAREPTPYSRRVDAAGLVVLGKTRCSEFALLGSTETLLEGVTRNPWDPRRSATGSSGGSAAAVAAGMVPVAHASDGGGSIRIPAAANGLFGLKPGPARVAPTAEADMHGLLIDHCLSWTVRDSALLLSLTSAEPFDFVAGPNPERLRIGVYTETLPGAEPAPEIAAACEATARLCAELGHRPIPTPPPPVDGARVSRAFFTVAGATMAGLCEAMAGVLGRPPGPDELEPFTLELIDWYRGLPEQAAAAALAEIEESGATMRRFLGDFDLVLCPTLPIAIPELGWLAPTLDRETIIERTEALAGYTPIHNMAGVPAMSVPLHSDGAGLPMASHFAGPRGCEARLLSLAYELEKAAPWIGRRPPIHAANNPGQTRS